MERPPMTRHARFSRRHRMLPSRASERCRTRALDECDDGLDDWMVACPAAELARSD